jgi:glycerol uptake facilitator-like aquaporin
MVPNAAIVKIPGAFAVEIGATAALAFMICAITDSNNKAVPDGAQPALIGITVATLIAQLGTSFHFSLSCNNE